MKKMNSLVHHIKFLVCFVCHITFSLFGFPYTSTYSSTHHFVSDSWYGSGNDNDDSGGGGGVMTTMIMIIIESQLLHQKVYCASVSTLLVTNALHARSGRRTHSSPCMLCS